MDFSHVDLPLCDNLRVWTANKTLGSRFGSDSPRLSRKTLTLLAFLEWVEAPSLVVGSHNFHNMGHIFTKNLPKKQILPPKTELSGSFLQRTRSQAVSNGAGGGGTGFARATTQGSYGSGARAKGNANGTPTPDGRSGRRRFEPRRR